MVGANKNSVKILSEDEGRYAQGYFVYDSHKPGGPDRLAPELRPETDPGTLPDRPSQLHRLPPVQLPRAQRRPGAGRTPRHPPAQLSARRRRGLGAAAAHDAA